MWRFDLDLYNFIVCFYLFLYGLQAVHEFQVNDEMRGVIEFTFYYIHCRFVFFYSLLLLLGRERRRYIYSS